MFFRFAAGRGHYLALVALSLVSLAGLAVVAGAGRDRRSARGPQNPPPAAVAPALPKTKVRSVAGKPGWKRVFGDEFDGDRLDTKKWQDAYPGGVRTHSNNERQYYAPDGYQVSGGLLRLRAEKRTMGNMPYTSGMVTSFGAFAQKYGWWEIRAKMPQGKGLWPAFWLLPANKSWPPEIDVFEILAHEPNKVYFTNHWRNPATGKHVYKNAHFVGPDFSRDFHTFAAEWRPGEIIWYVDGIEHHRARAHVPARPMYVLANLAVGGDWPGNPDASTVFPSTMDIDYIHVYKWIGTKPKAVKTKTAPKAAKQQATTKPTKATTATK